MSAIDDLSAALFGNPPSDSFKPDRSGVLNAFTEIYNQVQNLVGGIKSYAAVANLPVGTDPTTDPAGAPVGSQARVYADATSSNNTYWVRKASTGANNGWVIDTDLINSIAAIVQPLVNLARNWASQASGPVDNVNYPGLLSAMQYALQAQGYANSISSVIKVATAGAWVPGVGFVAETHVDKSGRTIDFITFSGVGYYFDANGVAQKKVTQDQLTSKFLPSGAWVPGVGFVSDQTTLSNGRTAGFLLGLDGRPLVQDDDGNWFNVQNVKSTQSFDVIIYGSGLSGLGALKRLSKRGKRVCMIEPYSNWGGNMPLVSWADFAITLGVAPNNAPETNIMGGLTNQAMLDLQAMETALAGGVTQPKYTFQPKTAELYAMQTVTSLAARAIKNNPINPTDVLTEIGPIGKRGKGIFVNGDFITAKVFIDASYEGDVMAAILGTTGYIIGRESSTQYSESDGGYLTPSIQFNMGSGFTHYTGSGATPTIGYPFVADPGETIGQADSKVQSNCFRLPLTRVAANRIPFIKPDDYDISLLTTTFQILRNANGGAGYTKFCRDSTAASWGFQGPLPNGKVNWNGADLYNKSFAYPDAPWAIRLKNIKEHFRYQASLMWAIPNDPEVRNWGLGALQDDAIDAANGGVPGVTMGTNAIGLCADEFTGSQFGKGWPWWLYIREGRRMIGMYTMTAADQSPTGTPTKTHSIGKWAYNKDIHTIQAFIPNNAGVPYTDRGALEGTGSSSGTATANYQIPLESILPPASGCVNLITTVCCSTSHVAWGPDRLEIPQGFRGEAAGELAAWLVDNPTKRAQDFDYTDLSARLVQYGSKL